MAEPFDYQHNLLHAVRGFLAGTQESRAEAEAILRTCPRTEPFTVGDIVWGVLVSALGDSVIQADADYLEHLHRFLLGSAQTMQRGFLRYDLRSKMTPPEQACYAKLVEMVDFLEQFPFQAVEDALSEYTGRRAEIERLLADLPVVDQSDHETLYRLVLREVATVVLNVDIRLSMLVAHHLAPEPGYTSVQPYHRPPLYPDLTEGITWSRRALRSIAGQDWLSFSWHLTDRGLWFSVH